MRRCAICRANVTDEEQHCHSCQSCMECGIPLFVSKLVDGVIPCEECAIRFGVDRQRLLDDDDYEPGVSLEELNDELPTEGDCSED